MGDVCVATSNPEFTSSVYIFFADGTFFQVEVKVNTCLLQIKEVQSKEAKCDKTSPRQ